METTIYSVQSKEHLEAVYSNKKNLLSRDIKHQIDLIKDLQEAVKRPDKMYLGDIIMDFHVKNEKINLANMVILRNEMERTEK